MKIGLVGIGNVLMGDDGAGPYAIKLLEAGYSFPPDVTLVDAGTPGHELQAILLDYEAIIIIDTVKARGEPGEIRRYDRDTVLKGIPILAMSPHEPGLREALMSLDMTGEGPTDIVLVGVIPHTVDLGTELTGPVLKALPGLIDSVFSELSRLGVSVTPKDRPSEPDLWWRRKA